MFDLSISEILVIVVACVIFFKPEDIPEILKQCGKIFRKIKKTMNEFSSVLKLEEDEKLIKPKNKILGLDGEYHDAYDVKEVFEVKKDGK